MTLTLSFNAIRDYLLFFAICISALSALEFVLVPILANLRTPDNLKDWYKSNARMALMLFCLSLVAFTWGFYFFIVFSE